MWQDQRIAMKMHPTPMRIHLAVATLLVLLFLSGAAYAQAQCEDGIDNDGDTLIDYPADPDCLSPSDNQESPHRDMNATAPMTVDMAKSFVAGDGGSSGVVPPGKGTGDNTNPETSRGCAMTGMGGIDGIFMFLALLGVTTLVLRGRRPA